MIKIYLNNKDSRRNKLLDRFSVVEEMMGQALNVAR